MNKIRILLLTIIIAVLLIVCRSLIPVDLEKNCINSGGTVTETQCCMATGDFPNSCLIGACACAPNYSHQTKVCDCGENKCFNGKKCVL